MTSPRNVAIRYPLSVRSILCALALGALAVGAAAQHRSGVYRPQGATPEPWSINAHGALIWAGQPYLPFGLHIDGARDAVASARQSGVADMEVDLPASGEGWADCLSALADAKSRYLIRISSLAPMAEGIAVEPQSYRLSNISKSQSVRVSIPSATRALVILASARDASIESKAVVPLKDGVLTYDVNLPSGLDSVLLIYPEMRSLSQPDYWEGMDEHRDRLLASLAHQPLGTGLRGIVNPLGRTLTLPSKQVEFVPVGSEFRLELQELMQKRYKNLETAQRSWAMGASGLSSFDETTKARVASFEDLARLVPLWSGARGVSYLWDPNGEQLYACDNRHSTIWHDISDVVAAAQHSRTAALVNAIHSVADVPVIQEWEGWCSTYEGAEPVVDGIGMRAVGSSTSDILNSSCRAASSLLRWPQPGWLIATDIEAGADAATQLPGALDDLQRLGARGAFLRSQVPGVLTLYASESAKRSADTSLADADIQAVFFPENATNPAQAQRLPGGKWWLPAPIDGNRLDLGSNYFAYRLKDDKGGAFAIWTSTPGRVRLYMASPKTSEFLAVDGSDPQPKLTKGGVELSVGEVPIIVSGTDEVPVPEPAYLEVLDRFGQLLKASEANMRDTSEERFYFQDALSRFERNPGASFLMLRDQFKRLSRKLGAFTWIEAEGPAETNFSEATQDAGCSAGTSLCLRSRIDPGPEGFYAEYPLQVKTQDDQVAWIAAKIPADERSNVLVTISGQTLTISGPPMSPYGSGYAWYKLGTTRLAGSTSKLRLQANGLLGDEICVDAIVLAPDSFQPNGVTYPDAIRYLPTPQKGKIK